MSKKFNKVVTETAKRWKGRAKKDRTNRRIISRAQSFALELMDYLETHKIKQTELAVKMGVTPQQVNKILRGKANLTFETLDKIAGALNAVITSPKIRTNARVRNPITHYSVQVVNKRTMKRIEQNLTTKKITKKNPVLGTSMLSMDSYAYMAKQI